MKKSNVIIFALLVLCSAFLLWLWYFLGFNHVDSPVDLVLSIVWWVVIVACIAIIAKMEQARRRRIRTVYVGDIATFNSERGLVRLEDAAKPMKDVLAGIIEDLKYDFTREDFPDKDKFQVRYFVRTKEFKAEDADEQQQTAQASAEGAAAEGAAPVAPAAAADATQPLTPAGDASAEQHEQKTWKGEVVVVDTQEERSFDTPEELAAILADLQAKAA